jgi:hypothetical protein
MYSSGGRAMMVGGISFGDFLPHLGPLVAVLGTAVYAGAFLPTDSFYRTFGVSLDDVGLTKTKILTRAAIYLFAFFAFVVVMTLANAWWNHAEFGWADPD